MLLRTNIIHSALTVKQFLDSTKSKRVIFQLIAFEEVKPLLQLSEKFTLNSRKLAKGEKAP
jgi:hypothetical protein